MNVEKGYVDEPIEAGIDLREEILRLKKERNAIIMAHYYQREEIQQLADHIGDSLALAQMAAKTDAPVIILCGVHFMGETAKILCPDKTVIVPDLSAGCSLADSCPADEFERFVNEHPDHTVIIIKGHSLEVCGRLFVTVCGLVFFLAVGLLAVGVPVLDSVLLFGSGALFAFGLVCHIGGLHIK